MNFFSVRTKLIFILSLILLSGFFITNLISYRASRASLRSSIIDSSLPLARDNIYSEILRDLARPIFVSSLMANDTFLKDWVIEGEKNPDLILKYLREIQERYGFFSSFFVSDKTGYYYHFEGILKQIRPEDDHDVWYYRFKSLNTEYDLDVDTNEAAKNHLTIFINHRLTGYGDQFLGAVGVGLDFDRIADLLDLYREKYGRNIYMSDANGIIQIHEDKKHVDTTTLSEIPGLSGIADRILAAKTAPAFFEYDNGTANILLTSRYIKELGWYLLVEQDETLALKSIQGTFVQNFLLSLLITSATIVFAVLVINYFQKQLEVMATTDKLTKAYNRREFEHRFHFHTRNKTWKTAAMSLILFDIDHLKTVNDTHGHLFGDRVIQTIAAIAADTIREGDMLVRWGGDEFVMLIFSDTAQAERIAGRLTEAVFSHDFTDGKPVDTRPTPVSISCGITGYREKDTLEMLIHRADEALYEAKECGRNCIRTRG
ncbi:MAG: sensor domain-containing diguanylate cyclase [Desulfobacterales bacterium]|nr:sensor domain-containing diguanylate cyclase [Desulfobacterales bacterium]